MKMKIPALLALLCISTPVFAQQAAGSYTRYRRQASTPPSPPSGFVSAWVRNSDGHMCTVDDAGTVVDLASGGGGGGFTIATNQICYATGTNAPGGANTLTYTPTNSTSGHVGPVVVASSGSSVNGVGITLDASSDTNGHKWNIEAQGSAAPASNTTQGDLIWYDSTQSKVLLDLDTSGDLTPGNANGNQTLGDNGRPWFAINTVLIALTTTARSPSNGGQIVYDGTHTKFSDDGVSWVNMAGGGGAASMAGWSFPDAAVGDPSNAASAVGGSFTVGGTVKFTTPCTIVGETLYWAGGVGAKTVVATVWDPTNTSVATGTVAVNSAGKYSVTFGTPVSVGSSVLNKNYTIGVWDNSGNGYTHVTGAGALLIPGRFDATTAQGATMANPYKIWTEFRLDSAGNARPSSVLAGEFFPVDVTITVP